MKNVMLTCLFLLSIIEAYSKVLPDYKVEAPLKFIENKGQVTDQFHGPRNDIQFKVSAGGGLNIFIGDGAIHYQFSKPNEAISFPQPGKDLPGSPVDKVAKTTFTMYRMDVELVGANKNARVIKEEESGYYENYFTAGTEGREASAHAFSRITYKDVYPGIDWVLYTVQGKMKHEFVVGAGGKVSDIRLRYGGAIELKLDKDGSLIARTPMGVINEQAPYTYQADGAMVSSNYYLSGDVLSYDIGAYTGSLVIDPVLVWGTYYGGDGSDYTYSSAADNSGNVYICGYTQSTSAIATTGAYQTTYGGNTDGFLAKFSKTGALLWATYYGGNSDDIGRAVTTDGTGNVFIAGSTSSTAAIATPGAYQTTYQGTDDGFLAKFNSAGVIQWGTYYGGTNSDYIYDLATDGSGNVYFTGQTMSNSGIATPGAFRASHSGNYDAFLVKFNSSGARQWGTYYGGNSADYGHGVATDGSGNVYINGYTASASTMTTTGAHQTVLNGIYDAYLAKFNSSGAIQWATYFGGDAYDYGNALAVDGSGNPYITGYTNSTAGLATSGAYQTAFGGGTDAYVAKFNSAGAIQWATYYGGSDGDEGNGIGTDASGNIYFTGFTLSSSAIATVGAYQTVLGGGMDVFLARFSSAGAINWATYYGGSLNESASCLSVSDSDNVYISGYTRSTSAIATPGAYQTTLGSTNDAFLARFNFCSMPAAGSISGTSSLCVGGSITLVGSTPGGLWSSSSPAMATVGGTGIVTGVASGTSTISYAITNLCGTAVATKDITVNPMPDAGAITGPDMVCIGSSITLSDASPGGIWSVVYGNVTLAGGLVTGITAGVDTVKYSVSNACGAASATKIITIVDCSAGVANEPGRYDKMMLYPNPTRNSVTIASSTDIDDVVLTNLFGQVVFSGGYGGRLVEIDLSQLADGIYFVKINNSAVYKVIKQ